MSYRRQYNKASSTVMAVKSKNPAKLKKHYIIREYDLDKLSKDFTYGYAVSFKPLTQEYFSKRSTFFYLKNKKYLGDQYALHEYPAYMLQRLTNIPIWNNEYTHWMIKYNDQGFMTIKVSLRRTESNLGIVTFRKLDNEN